MPYPDDQALRTVVEAAARLSASGLGFGRTDRPLCDPHARARDEADGRHLIAIQNRNWLFRRRTRHLIDEAGDRLQTAIARNESEVGSDEMQRGVRCSARLPLEAHAIIMRIDVVLEAEAVACEMLLQRPRSSR